MAESCSKIALSQLCSNTKKNSCPIPWFLTFKSTELRKTSTNIHPLPLSPQTLALESTESAEIVKV